MRGETYLSAYGQKPGGSPERAGPTASNPQVLKAFQARAGIAELLKLHAEAIHQREV